MKKQKNFNRREMLKMGLKTGVVLGGSTLISTRGIGLTRAYGKQCTGLVRLRMHHVRGVKVPFRENAFRPVADLNCDTVRCGGKQGEVKS